MKKKKYIKIISGKFKNFKINILDNKLLKPTTNIARKTLFNWLNPYIKNKKCLDCFAGTGILSIESISRYAKHVIILEKNYKFFKKIKSNLYKINKKKYKIININTFIWLKKKKNTIFDIIFIDPPYIKKHYICKILYIINKNKLCNNNTLIYIETYKNNNFIKKNKNWIIIKKKKNQTSLFLLIKKNIYKTK